MRSLFCQLYSFQGTPKIYYLCCKQMLFTWCLSNINCQTTLRQIIYSRNRFFLWLLLLLCLASILKITHFLLKRKVKTLKRKNFGIF